MSHEGIGVTRNPVFVSATEREQGIKKASAPGNNLWYGSLQSADLMRRAFAKGEL